MPEVGGDGDGHLGVQALPVEPVQRDTPEKEDVSKESPFFYQ